MVKNLLFLGASLGDGIGMRWISPSETTPWVTPWNIS